LGDVAEITAGGDINKGDLINKGKYPVIANGLNNNGIVGYSNKYKIDAPAVTITGRGTLGVATARFINFTPIVRLISIKSDLDPIYLENVINNTHFVIESTGVPQLTAPQVKRQTVILSNCHIEQTKIGSLLSILDNTITLHEEKKRQFERIKSALLKKVFTDKSGYPSIRFEGFDKVWKQSKLGEITKVIPSKPYISTPSTHGNYLVIQQGDKPIAGFSDSKPFNSYNNITLFGDHTLSLFKPRSPFLVASDGIKILSPSIEMNGLFYFYALEKYKPQSEGYKRHFTILKKSEANFPTDIDEQKQISSLLLRIDNLIDKQQLRIDKLNETKKSLLQNMFI
jgi:type I restriction enzyme S subunit